MRSVERRIDGDCAVYAVAAYLGIPYETVAGIFPPLTPTGIPSQDLVPILKGLWKYGGHELRSGIPPSDDSWKATWFDLTGIVGFHRPGRLMGHLAAVRNGIVLDFDGTKTPILDWCKARDMRVLVVYY